MSEAREPLRHIAIAGAGQVGVLAAIAMKRALPMAEVTVIGIPLDPTAFADHAATALPFTLRMHDRFGIPEELLVTRAGGSHRLVTRYLGWSGEGHRGSFAYGAAIDPALKTAFAREWGGGAASGTGVDRPAGSLAEVLADAGRFASPAPGDPSPLGKVEYALRWNPPAYRDLLIAAAQQIGVRYLPDDIAGGEPNGQGGFGALALASGARLPTDLILDCTGPATRLLSVVPGYRREDWSDFLPLRTLMVMPPREPVAALEDRFSLRAEGWLSEMAGRDGVRASLGVTHTVAEDAAQRALGGEPQIVLPVAPGCAGQAWLGNVVALGDAAATFEPLGFLNLDLAHRQLDLLLELLPGRDIRPGERREFNRRAALMAVAVRDTLATHYATSRARAVFGPAQLPDGLAIALDQFARRGRLPFQEEAPFLGEERQALLAALGHPQGTPPQSRAGQDGVARAARREFAEKAEAALAAAPPYREWLLRVLEANRAPGG
ncbi:hypothetical protein F7D01_12995 [Erythrobacter sp. 3-20A1M]|uniref:tryptophan 7-halogenase n=1 Tax=Erythrobacter sp. 3-20A1M TaxID=2653850 RepID=UPI001BFCC8DC|nr:tryptophan 7-halogenase [Erythrobacter sp. 3-20A1M]QWC57861.1 hypothetical protein F7D01_12995 [Erythrobacter sp. 3-20A1M]